MFEFSINRILAVAERDLRRFRRNTKLMIPMALMPIIYLVILGKSMGGDLHDLPLALVVQDKGHAAEMVADRLVTMEQSRKLFKLAAEPDPETAVEKLRQGHYKAVVIVPPTFSEELSRGDAADRAGVDNTDNTSANVIEAEVRRARGIARSVARRGRSACKCSAWTSTATRSSCNTSCRRHRSGFVLRCHAGGWHHPGGRPRARHPRRLLRHAAVGARPRGRAHAVGDDAVDAHRHDGARLVDPHRARAAHRRDPDAAARRDVDAAARARPDLVHVHADGARVEPDDAARAVRHPQRDHVLPERRAVPHRAIPHVAARKCIGGISPSGLACLCASFRPWASRASK